MNYMEEDTIDLLELAKALWKNILAIALVAVIVGAGAADHYVCGPRNDDGSHDVEHFGTTTPELNRMLQWLRERRVESVAMESISVYWIPGISLGILRPEASTSPRDIDTATISVRTPF